MTIGTLFAESRLIAKTVNRIILDPDYVGLQDWRAEGKLLCSPGGDCLLSTTLLVKGKYVPTYGIDGRCYGLLLDANKCYIYDVNSTDANTNRTDKLEKRATRKGIDFLTENTKGFKTLDQLSTEIKSGQDGHMNEVLLDAWKDSVTGLFVRIVDLESASTEALKHYYQSLLEIKLIQKFLIQTYGFPPESLMICQYNEREGRLLKFPSDEHLYAYARMHGFSKATYPKLFELLSDEHTFKPAPKPITVKEYLEQNIPPEILSSAYDEICVQLAAKFEPFDARPVDAISILSEPVDDIIGLPESTIKEVTEIYLLKQKVEEMSLSASRDSFFNQSKASVTLSEDPVLNPASEKTDKKETDNTGVYFS